MKALTVLTILTFILGSYANDHWICSCFKPDYDKGCCSIVNGIMYENVCNTPDMSDNSIKNYEKCCTDINGKYKCKYGS
jgi:hypothetical protein